ncbi:hypothetical protein ACFFRR_011439 [Megaselia abdita]
MENNEITMALDVKIDINDKRHESAFKLQSWAKCMVKIEAIKCIPCFLRITFITSIENDKDNLSVSINVPGVTTSLAISRTRKYSYGIFWIQNRKRCYIYLAAETDHVRNRHMTWVNRSIENLELHRHLLFESSMSKKNKSHKSHPLDVLGPLPQLPNETMNWSRRVSGVSGIYEEIGDPRKMSIVSGIYEEMVEPVVKAEEPSPRKRMYTFENRGFARSNTMSNSPWRSYKVLDKFLGFSKRLRYSNSPSKVSKKGATLKPTSSATNSEPHKFVPFKHNLQPRLSISTPDLSNLLNFDDPFEISSDFLNSSEEDEDKNVSKNIQPNFNNSLNSSTVNLVGSNLKNKTHENLDNIYCDMTKNTPKIKEKLHESTEYCSMVLKEGIYENLQNFLNNSDFLEERLKSWNI